MVLMFCHTLMPRKVTNIPGTDICFTVQKYQEATGMFYQRFSSINNIKDFANSCECSTQYNILDLNITVCHVKSSRHFG